MTDIPTRVQFLERSVAALAAAKSPRRSETLTPNYITVSPTGLVGADFTGFVHALGLQIPEGSGSAPLPTTNSIQWLKQSNGSVVASIGTALSGATHTQFITTQPGVGELAQTIIRASDSGGSRVVDLSVSQTGPSPQGGVTIQTATGVVTLFDQAGNSNFLQLTTSKNWALNGQSTGLVFPNSQFATTLTVNHGLSRTPAIILLSLGNGAVGASVTLSAGAAGNTTFTVDGFCSVALNTTVFFYWCAIG